MYILVCIWADIGVGAVRPGFGQLLTSYFNIEFYRIWFQNIGEKKMLEMVNVLRFFNPIALRKAKIVCNFGLSECNRVNTNLFHENVIANRVESRKKKTKKKTA